MRYVEAPHPWGPTELQMITERKELLTAICTVFRSMEEASSPTDPAVIQAKRSILNGLAEIHMVDALDDAPVLAALTAPRHK
jgi:hypothetical protein